MTVSSFSMATPAKRTRRDSDAECVEALESYEDDAALVRVMENLECQLNQQGAGIDAEDVLVRHRQSIRTHTRGGCILSVYNFDLAVGVPDLRTVIFE